MRAFGTDFDSPVTGPTPGSTESSASWPDADEAVGRKASQPPPPRDARMGQPNASTPYPTPPPHWCQRGGGALWPGPWTGHKRPPIIVS